MKYKYKIIFLKQDVFRLSTFIFWILSIISAGSIIFSIEYLGGNFSIHNVYAMFTTISEWLILFCAVNLFGREYQFKTINMIRVSNKNFTEILLRKWMIMMIICVLTAFISLIEVVAYAVIFGHEIDLIQLTGRLLLAYCIYGGFVFLFATTLVTLIKNTLYTFIVTLVSLVFIPVIINIISIINISLNISNFIPFCFMRNSFSFACFSRKQVAIMVVWSILLFVISNMLLKKKGYV